MSLLNNLDESIALSPYCAVISDLLVLPSKQQETITARQSESCLASTAFDVDGADVPTTGDISDDDRFNSRSIEAVDPAGPAARLGKQSGDLHHEGFPEAAEDVLVGLDVPGAPEDIVIVFIGHDPALL